LAPNPFLDEQLAYNPDEMQARFNDLYPHFNPQQKEAFDKVVDSVNNDRGNLFFLHSAGGGGKTHVCNTIAAAVRAKGEVALCVASSAIAALLLNGS
jgi:superfamily II DNA or RNA helicase